MYAWKSLCRTGWPQIHRDPSASASEVLRLKGWTSGFCMCFDKVSCSPSWPQGFSVTEGDLEYCSDLPASTSECWNYRCALPPMTSALQGTRLRISAC